MSPRLLGKNKQLDDHCDLLSKADLRKAVKHQKNIYQYMKNKLSARTHVKR